MILVFSHYLGLWVRSVHVFVVDEYWGLVHYNLTGIKYVGSLHILKQAIVSAVCQGNWESKATLSQISPDFDEMWSRKEKRKQPRTRHPRGRRRYMHCILNSASWLKWFLDQLNKIFGSLRLRTPSTRDVNAAEEAVYIFCCSAITEQAMAAKRYAPHPFRLLSVAM